MTLLAPLPSSIERRLGFNNGDLIFVPHLNPQTARQNRFSPTQVQLDRAFQLARLGFANLTLGLFAESFSSVPLHFSALAADRQTAVQVTGPGVTEVMTLNPNTRLPERFGRVRYEDYRDVAGRKVPFRIIEGADQWLVREFVVNVDIDGRVFKPTGCSSSY